MARKREQIVLELKKLLRLELRQADTEAAERKRRRIDEVLDERLEQKGAHAPDCSCHECWAHVTAVLARRSMGELADARDIATPGQW
jgi:hypothetical protein